MLYTNTEVIKKASIEKVELDWLWLIFIFLFSLNLFNKGNFLLIAVLFVGLIVIEYKKSRFKFTVDFFLLFMFSMTYYLILINYKALGIGAILIYYIGPISLFFIGYFIIKQDNKFIAKSILAIVLGNFIHGFLNMLAYFNIFGFTSLQRNVPDVWTGIITSATLQGTYFTLIVSLLFFVLFLYKNKIISAILLCAIIFSLFSSFILGNRTLIIITILVFAINAFLSMYINKNNIKKSLMLLSFLVIFLFLIWILYSFNIFGIKDFIISSQFHNRMEQDSITEDSRFLAYSRAVSQMFDYPFGGYQMNLGLKYAHNLWLDVLYATGLIPYFILILYTIKALANLISILQSNQVDQTFKILVASVYLGYILNFMVEPILEGVPYMFLSFCLLNGMIRKYADILNIKNA